MLMQACMLVCIFSHVSVVLWLGNLSSLREMEMRIVLGCQGRCELHTRTRACMHTHVRFLCLCF